MWVLFTISSLTCLRKIQHTFDKLGTLLYNHEHLTYLYLDSREHSPVQLNRLSLSKKTRHYCIDCIRTQQVPSKCVKLAPWGISSEKSLCLGQRFHTYQVIHSDKSLNHLWTNWQSTLDIWLVLASLVWSMPWKCRQRRPFCLPTGRHWMTLYMQRKSIHHNNYSWLDLLQYRWCWWWTLLWLNLCSHMHHTWLHKCTSVWSVPSFGQAEIQRCCDHNCHTCPNLL